MAEGVVGILRVDAPLDDERGCDGKNDKVPARTVYDFAREGFSDQFRFHSPEDIIRLIERGFGFPTNCQDKEVQVYCARGCFNLFKTPSLLFALVR